MAGHEQQISDPTTSRMASDLNTCPSVQTRNITNRNELHRKRRNVKHLRSSWRLPVPSAAKSRSVRVVSRVEPEEANLANLAQILAHRIRGLVTGIEGYTDLLMEGLDSREERQTALRILESAVRIERVLADLQRYSEPVEPVLRQTPLRSLIDELLVAVEDRDLERIRFDIGAVERVELEMDSVLMLQALLVLLQNGLDATRSSGNVLFVAAVDSDAHHVRFEVHNDGYIALAEAQVGVFQPFYTTKAHNLGVGLSIARRIVLAHGGTLILAENSPDRGIRFVIHLPIAPHTDDTA